MHTSQAHSNLSHNQQINTKLQMQENEIYYLNICIRMFNNSKFNEYK